MWIKRQKGYGHIMKYLIKKLEKRKRKKWKVIEIINKIDCMMKE